MSDVEMLNSLFGQLMFYHADIESRHAQMEENNKCKTEATGRPHAVQRQPSDSEANMISRLQLARQLDYKNCPWTLEETMETQKKAVETDHYLIQEARTQRENFSMDLVIAYVRNCLNSDKHGPGLHRDTIYNHLNNIDTDLTYKLSRLHTLADNLVRNSGDVIDQFRTNIGDVLIKLSAPPRANASLAAYKQLTCRVPWHWARNLPNGLTWNHVATMLMIVADVVCNLYKTNPQDLAAKKAKLCFDVPARVLEKFVNEIENWKTLKTMDLEELPVNFTLPNNPPAGMTNKIRDDILQKIRPCHLFYGVCPPPFPRLLDIAFSALPGETIAQKQEIYEKNHRSTLTAPIFL